MDLQSASFIVSLLLIGGVLLRPTQHAQCFFFFLIQIVVIGGENGGRTVGFAKVLVELESSEEEGADADCP